MTGGAHKFFKQLSVEHGCLSLPSYLQGSGEEREGGRTEERQPHGKTEGDQSIRKVNWFNLAIRQRQGEESLPRICGETQYHLPLLFLQKSGNGTPVLEGVSTQGQSRKTGHSSRCEYLRKEMLRLGSGHSPAGFEHTAS